MCEKCSREFESLKDQKEHMKKHRNPTTFECNECERKFDEEWKLCAHKKNHLKYPCNLCDKTFKSEDIRDIHVRISHEGLQLFCHFFNNKMKCPHGGECIFLHKESGICKYGGLCERKYCMYKHEDSDIEDDDFIENETVQKDNDESENEAEENEEDDIGDDDIGGDDIGGDDIGEHYTVEDDIGNDNIKDIDEEIYDAYDDKNNRTFQNPSQSGMKDNSTVCAEMLKCGMCDFRCMTKCDIRDHKERTHNWCYICYSSFDNQTKLKNHNNATHSENN